MLEEAFSSLSGIVVRAVVGRVDSFLPQILRLNTSPGWPVSARSDPAQTVR